jgi:PAT family beta-lactamase induction signal transducer AmpG
MISNSSIMKSAGVFAQPKMGFLLLLGVSSGIPLFLTSRTLQFWLTVEGVGLETIGLLSLAGLPYSVKFLWAPILDRFIPPFLGRRRGWILLLQVALAGALFFLAFQDPGKGMGWFAFWVVAVAFLSASQDIVIDAYRADILEPPEMGVGAAVGVLGYRLALLLAGSLVPVWVGWGWMSWPSAYAAMALVLLGVSLVTLRAPEPPLADRNIPSTLGDAVVRPLSDFTERLSAGGVPVFLFVVFYKWGDSLLANMTVPFLLKAGFGQAEVGVVQGGVGLTFSIVGALVGGALLHRWGINRSLWLFGGFQAASNAVYYFLSLAPSRPLMIATVIQESFCSGLGMSAFVAFLMRLCRPSYSATQYALLTGLMAFSRDILVAPAGKLAVVVGWPAFFLLTIACALPGMVLLAWVAPWNASDPGGAVGSSEEG